MQIYQLSPTIVVRVKDEIVKIFDSADECRTEADRLNKVVLPLVDRSHSGDYEMSVVKVVSSVKNILIMEKAQGVSIVKSKNMRLLVNLVGGYLAKFHQNEFNIDGISSPRLFGDFSIDHVFIDSDHKKISTIDPGGNFMVIGNQLEDVARFLFSVTESFRYRPLICCKVLKAFLSGYQINREVELCELKEVLDFRKKRSIVKYKLQKSPIKALLGVLILNYNRLVIKMVLKC